jgi:HD-GYP domain-containing protein (c-di-GMP phosphodiesterase class II)
MRRTGTDRFTDRLQDASPHTHRHSKAVAEIAMGVGSLARVPDDIMIQLGLSGHLHDIGKMSPKILGLVEAPRRLTRTELGKVRDVHTTEGHRMITGRVKASTGYQGLLRTAAYVALHHHDSPEELPGDQHQQVARDVTGLIHVIDRFEATQSGDRPYQSGPATSPETAASRVEAEVDIQPFYGLDPGQVMAAVVSSVQVNR